MVASDMTVSGIDDRMLPINQGAPIVDIQQTEHPMDQLFRPGGRQGEEVFSPVYVKDMRHWATIIFCADTDKPEKYIDSLGDLTARKKRQEKLKFLPFLNRLGASLNPPKTWKSVEVLPVSSQQGAGCILPVSMSLLVDGCRASLLVRSMKCSMDRSFD